MSGVACLPLFPGFGYVFQLFVVHNVYVALLVSEDGIVLRNFSNNCGHEKVF